MRSSDKIAERIHKPFEFTKIPLEDFYKVPLSRPLEKKMNEELMGDTISHKTMLDLCCRTHGIFARNYADDNACVALDIDLKKLRSFKNLYKDGKNKDMKNTSVECVIADAAYTPFRTHAFDRTYVSFAMCSEFVDEVRRITKEAVISGYLWWKDYIMKLVSEFGSDVDIISAKDFYRGLKNVGVFYIHLNLK